jgi:hypothetical protein
VGDGKFYALHQVRIRLDKVTTGPEKTIHAFVTLKNLTDAEQTILGHTIKAYAEDADGMAFRASKIARASTPEAESFDNNPKVAPAGSSNSASSCPRSRAARRSGRSSSTKTAQR